MADVDLERVGNLVERVVRSEGLEFVHWDLRGQGPKSLLRITIDRPEGISHGDCVAVNNRLGTLLDVEDLIPFGYTLEVSSPGLGRALSGRADFERHSGEIARIRSSEPIAERIGFKGRIERVTHDDVTLLESTGEHVSIPLSKIFAANLVHVPRGARTGESSVEAIDE